MTMAGLSCVRVAAIEYCITKKSVASLWFRETWEQKFLPEPYGLR